MQSLTTTLEELDADWREVNTLYEQAMKDYLNDTGSWGKVVALSLARIRAENAYNFALEGI